MSYCAPFSDLIFQDHYGIPIFATFLTAILIIGVVKNAILNSLIWLAIIIEISKQVILPLFPALCWRSSSTCISFKQISVLGVANKVVDRLREVEVDTYRSLIFDKLTHEHQISFSIAITSYNVPHLLPVILILESRFFIHIPDCLILSLW